MSEVEGYPKSTENNLICYAVINFIHHVNTKDDIFRSLIINSIKISRQLNYDFYLIYTL